MNKLLVFLVFLILSSGLFAQEKLSELTPRDHEISLIEAEQYTARYETSKGNSKVLYVNIDEVKKLISDSNAKWLNIDIRGEEPILKMISSGAENGTFTFYGEQVLDHLNKYSGSKLAIKGGMDPEFGGNVVLDLVDNLGKPTDNVALQASYPCPPNCD